MENMIAGAGSFFVSLIAGDSFSSIVSPTENIKKALAKKELNELLDEYHKWFIREHDTEISSCNEDMVLFVSKRKEILNSFEKYYLKGKPDINTNREEQFLEEAYQLVSPDGLISEIGEKYLSDFFQVVLAKKTGVLPLGMHAAINSLSDQVNAEFRKQDRRISEAEEKIERFNTEESVGVNLDKYYAGVLDSFTGPNVEESAGLVGEESDEKAYLDAYIEAGSKEKLALDYLERWFDEQKYGVILIYGEPGHGKSTLCKKATVDYIKGKLLKNKANNVLRISLNTGDNPGIITDGALKISNALVWGADSEYKFCFEDCRDSLLFMDGFDEFIDTAKTRIKDINIVSFINRIDKIARQYDIHIVVLSRTIAVQEYLEDKAISGRCFQLLPITKKQQDDWLDRHTQYDDYRKTFIDVRENRNMGELLGIPLLFRLIVHNRFSKVSSNIVELYDNLFDHLMAKRGIIHRDKKKSVNDGLMNLAYDIYCTDTKTAVMKEEDWNTDWIFAFYLTLSVIEQDSLQLVYKVGFYHRTFYQYFFAQYIYCTLLNVTNKNAKNFIGYFAERELDAEVRAYLSLMLKELDKETIYSKMDIVINALVVTEGFYNLTPKYFYSNAEKDRIRRSANVYRNVMHIAYALSFVIQIPFKDNLDIICRTFQSSDIKICSNDEIKANLEKANLVGADLREANLCGAKLFRADLSRADLRKANLREANLRGANLKGANLVGANLFGAKLNGADLSRADLEEANLIGANLSRADLREVNLFGADLREANLSGANLFGVNLRGADLLKSNLSNAYMWEAHMIRVDLREANLREADLSGTNLFGADLRGADLSGADLLRSNLSNAYMLESKLNGADLSRANLLRTTIDTGINMVKSLSRTYIDEKYKELIHKDIKGYDSIIWSDRESQDDRLLY